MVITHEDDERVDVLVPLLKDVFASSMRAYSAIEAIISYSLPSFLT